MGKRTPPEIYRYHDYRAFLRDWLAFIRQQNKVSMRKLAAGAGLSVAYLSMILAGTRNFSDEALEKLLPHLGLDRNQEAYFRLLRTIAESESQDVRVAALKKLQKFSAYRHLNQNEVEAYRYLTNWYYVAIREMVGMPEFRADPRWIQSKLKYQVPLEEIAKALQFLSDYRFIELLPDGRARLPEKQVDCWGGIYKIVLAQFHQEMFSLASRSIDTTPRDQRNITFHTMAFSSERFEMIRKIMDEALAKVRELGESENSGDAVYHISFAGFPLTEVAGKGEEK